MATLDAALGGGWPRGEWSELVGDRSSGRTSTMLQTMAHATSSGELVAMVDALDRFDPQSAESAGVDLTRVLWVRGPACSVEMARPGLIERAVQQAIRATDLIVRAGGFGVVLLDAADVPALFLRALPATTWMRLARANEGQTTAVVCLTSVPISRSARGLSVRLDATGRWIGDSAQSRRLAGLDVRAAVAQPGRQPRTARFGLRTFADLMPEAEAEARLRASRYGAASPVPVPSPKAQSPEHCPPRCPI